LLLPSTKFANVKSGFRREREVGIQAPADLWQRRRARRAQFRAPGGQHLGLLGAARTHLDHDFRGRRGHEFVHQFEDALRAVLVHPVHDIAVRREQPQAAPVFHRLQREDPGVVMLGREFLFEAAQALVPESRFHDRQPRK